MALRSQRFKRESVFTHDNRFEYEHLETKQINRLRPIENKDKSLLVRSLTTKRTKDLQKTKINWEVQMPKS